VAPAVRIADRYPVADLLADGAKLVEHIHAVRGAWRIGEERAYSGTVQRTV
jgi:hypothetical protein